MQSDRRIIALAALAVFGLAPLLVRAVEPGKPAVTALETTAYRAIGANDAAPLSRRKNCECA